MSPSCPTHGVEMEPYFIDDKCYSYSEPDGWQCPLCQTAMKRAEVAIERAVDSGMRVVALGQWSVASHAESPPPVQVRVSTNSNEARVQLGRRITRHADGTFHLLDETEGADICPFCGGEMDVLVAQHDDAQYYGPHGPHVISPKILSIYCVKCGYRAKACPDCASMMRRRRLLKVDGVVLRWVCDCGYEEVVEYPRWMNKIGDYAHSVRGD